MLLFLVQKAGFMLVEVSFARNVKEKRNVVITVRVYTTQTEQILIPNPACIFHLQKHQDAFASAFGFFLLGFDVISRYSSPQGIHIQFFGITDPVLWFFKVATVIAD